MDATWTTVENVGVDHGCFGVRVPQQFLDGPDIVATFQQVCREAVPKGVAGDPLAQFSLQRG